MAKTNQTYLVLLSIRSMYFAIVFSLIKVVFLELSPLVLLPALTQCIKSRADYNRLELALGYHFYRFMKNAITSYRALDLENDIAGG